MKYFKIITLFVFLATGYSDNKDQKSWIKPDHVVHKIAFGSCLKNPKKGDILSKVVEYKPDLFIWLGDNIYVDTNTDKGKFNRQYTKLGSNPLFKKLNETCPNLATWDDHDYGNNNVDMRYPLKKTAKEEFGKFWKVPKDNQFWHQEGIYRFHEFGTKGKLVQVILLDGRWFRDSKNATKKDSYLGKKQWAWLETVLKRPADLRIICSGLQVLRINSHKWEMVGQHPSERQALFDIVTRTKANGVVFISGDKHFSEIHRTTKTPYPLYDVTSSGLDTAWRTIGKSQDTGDYEKVGESLRDYNFGSITIDWSKTSVKLQIRNSEGKVHNEKEVDLELLK